MWPHVSRNIFTFVIDRGYFYIIILSNTLACNMVTLCKALHCQTVRLIILTDLKLNSRLIFLSIKTGNSVREQLFIYIQQLNKKQIHKLPAYLHTYYIVFPEVITYLAYSCITAGFGYSISYFSFNYFIPIIL